MRWMRSCEVSSVMGNSLCLRCKYKTAFLNHQFSFVCTNRQASCAMTEVYSWKRTSRPVFALS